MVGTWYYVRVAAEAWANVVSVDHDMVAITPFFVLPITQRVRASYPKLNMFHSY